MEPSKTIFDKLVEASKKLGLDCQVGITTSAPGFFVSQGNLLKENPMTIDALDGVLGASPSVSSKSKTLRWK